MFQNILKSLSGSFADLGRWEPTADRSEVALRNGLEKSLLFVLCSSAIMGVSALTLEWSKKNRFQAVEGVAERLPEPPRVRVPEIVPSLDECVAKLPSYDKTRSFVKRIVDALTPVSLPQRIRDLMETRVY
ncbi:hypothetical protein, conserved [Eimeria brunetti]|uniref:Uncharacterized protein n=1 Tax=Eimeria brunetti TaxID=51314 RepID=U6LRQ8_9EIME|nr:hypothetical protein, conserved [Eimeria brunetti]